MTLEEATKTIESIKLVCRTPFPPNEQEALSLGVEALKRVKEARVKVYFTTRTLLPGETNE